MTRRTVQSPCRLKRCMWIAERSGNPCSAREQWQVCLDVRSCRNADYHRVVTPFKVCTTHKKAVGLGAILDGGGWTNIRNEFRRLGKKEPRRRLTELVFERIEEIEAKRAFRASETANASSGYACQAS